MSQPEIVLTLPDGSERRVAAGTTALDVAAAIGPKLARDAVGAELDGRLVETRFALGERGWRIRAAARGANTRSSRRGGIRRSR